MKTYKEKLSQLKCFIFDIDGVLTNGKIVLSEDGGIHREISSKDSYAIRKAIKEGFKVAIISSGNSTAVKYVFENMGVDKVILKSQNKLEDLKHYITESNIDLKKVLYMGDELSDYAICKAVGVSCSPANATPEILAIVDYQSPFNGGEGAVRDVISQALKLHNRWFEFAE